jgi:hypothetical protein
MRARKKTSTAFLGEREKREREEEEEAAALVFSYSSFFSSENRLMIVFSGLEIPR